MIVQIGKCFRIIIFQIKLLQTDIFLEHIDGLCVRQRTIQLNYRALQHPAHKLGLFHHVAINAGNGAPPLGIDFHNLYLGQLNQRLPHRCAGEPHLCGQLVFTDQAAWLQLKADNVVLQHAQRVVAARLPGETLCQIQTSRLLYFFHLLAYKNYGRPSRTSIFIQFSALHKKRRGNFYARSSCFLVYKYYNLIVNLTCRFVKEVFS